MREGRERGFLWSLAIWFAAAGLALLSGTVRDLPPGPWPQLFGAATFIGGTLAFFFWPRMRAWGMGLDLRGLTLFQAWCVVPALTFFYYYHRRGELPYDFVTVAGYGDLMVAALAVVAAGVAGRGVRWKWKALGGFHVFGLLDLTAVLATAFRNLLLQPEVMAPFREFPLGLLPLMLVPATLVAHVMALAKVRQHAM
jgi:hypothetical protein